MATKTASKKNTKTTTKSSAKKTAPKAPKASEKTSDAKRSKLPVGFVCEAYPENHIATGKYKFFFIFFGITTVLFAAVSVQLFIFSNQILEKWESLESCSRNGQSCVIINANKDDDNIIEPKAEDSIDGVEAE